MTRSIERTQSEVNKAMGKKLGKFKGVNPASDRLGTMSLDTDGTVYEGTFLYEKSDEAVNRLQLATGDTNQCQFILEKRVTVDGPTQVERMTGTDVGEVAAGEEVPVFLLKPGQDWETGVVATTGTGALSSGTPIETSLSVIDGEVVEKQNSGAGSVEFFLLKENMLDDTDNPMIRLLVTHVGA